MIQRIQSVLLLFSAICMIAMLFVTIWKKSDVDKNERITITAMAQMHDKVDIETGEVNVVSESVNYYVAILAVLAAGVAFYSISRYDNRLLQMKLGALNSLLMGGTLGAAVYLAIQAEKVIRPDIRGDYVEGFYLGVAALLLNAMANRFIRRDERLVRSADRIR